MRASLFREETTRMVATLLLHNEMYGKLKLRVDRETLFSAIVCGLQTKAFIEYKTSSKSSSEYM